MQQDQFQRLLPTFIQIIDLTEQEAAEYWMVVSTILEGKSIAAIPSSPSYFENSIPNTNSSTIMETSVNNKVGRIKLQYEMHLPFYLSLLL